LEFRRVLFRSLDPETDCDRERADLLAVLDAPADLHADEWIADAHLHADQPLQLVLESRQVGGSTRENDLADAEGSWLVLVELERADELAREGLELAADRLASLVRLRFAQTFDERPVVADGQRALDRLRFGGRDVERPRDGDVERAAAPVEHARELARTPVGDGEGRSVVADRDDDERGL